MQRRQANRAVRKAIHAGLLPPAQKCCLCDTTQGPSGKNVVWHHDSYEPEDWLKVAEVCAAHHQMIHGGSIPEPRTGIYRPTSYGLTRPVMEALMHALLPYLAIPLRDAQVAPEHVRLYRGLRNMGLVRGLLDRQMPHRNRQSRAA